MLHFPSASVLIEDSDLKTQCLLPARTSWEGGRCLQEQLAVPGVRRLEQDEERHKGKPDVSGLCESWLTLGWTQIKVISVFLLGHSSLP